MRLPPATLVALAILGALPSRAEIEVFTDRSLWEAELDGFATETFGLPDAEPLAANITHTLGSVTFFYPGRPAGTTPSIIFGFFRGNVTVPNVGTFPGAHTFGFPLPVTAWGADFERTTAAGLLTVTTDGHLVKFRDHLAGRGDGFLGIVSDVPFTSIVFGVQGPPASRFLNEIFSMDDLSYGHAMPEVLQVGLDIKPGSEVSPVNPSSRGLIPVAILASETFDVAEVDVTTLAFGPGSAIPKHRKGGHLEDVDGDGLADLVSHYPIEEAGLAFGQVESCVTGELLDGTPIEGCDSIATVGGGCGLGFELAVLLPPLCWLHRRRRSAGKEPLPM